MDATTDKIFQAALEGHNFIVLGQAGTGKSFLLKKLKQELEKHGKVAQLTASTGIASASLGGCTIHHFSGIEDGRYPNDVIVKNLLHNDDKAEIKQRIVTVDTVIVDEISMLSWKNFSQIEYVFRNVRNKQHSFGGIQMILAGDFYQLKPVANIPYNDPGELLILHSDNFKQLIPHQFILREIYRQHEEDLVRAVNGLAKGVCTLETEQLLMRLQRPLPPGPNPTRLFALRYDVEKCNSDNLLEMPGEQFLYASTDDGNLTALATCQARKHLYLKTGAPVMLLVNLSSRLVNGRRGVVKQMSNDAVTVQFDGLDTLTTVGSFTFTVYSPDKGCNIASRRQIPLQLAFALTVHKAQGLSIDRLEVDCQNMKTPGQIGVAIGRATRKQGLRVQNFNRQMASKQPNYIEEFYNSVSYQLEENASCCSTMHFLPAVQSAHSSQEHDAGETQLPAHEHDPDVKVTIESDNDDEDDIDDSEMLQALELMEAEPTDENTCITLPEDIKCHSIVEKVMYKEPCTSQQRNINEKLDMLRSNTGNTDLFTQKVYLKLKSEFDRCVPESKRTSGTLSNQNLTSFYAAFGFFIKSDEYSDYVKQLFLTSQINSIHFRVAFGFVQEIRQFVVRENTLPIKEAALKQACQSGKQFKGSEAGRAKLRYIGGWCVAKLLYNKRNMVLRNLYKEEARKRVDHLHEQVKLLESLKASESSLLETSTDKPSLAHIQRKQNLSGSLCHITDKAFDFFQNLDVMIRNVETVEHLNLHGKDFYKFISSSILESETLNSNWSQLFTDGNFSGASENIECLKREIVNKYLLMSSAQFRKDYKRMQSVKKEAEHRKQIQMSSKQPVNLAPTASKSSTSTIEKETQNLPKKSKKVVEQPKRKGAATKGRGRKPKVAKWPCGLCSENCEIESVCCDDCDRWFHYYCLGLSGDELELREDEWFCAECKALSQR